jgi:tripartite-type tricarboxylate transporter receptor subunit TctC
MNKGRTLRSIWVFIMVIFLLVWVPVIPSAMAAEPSVEFWKGKIVNLIVPHGAGGGYDTYARLLAPYIEKYSGCTIVVDNVTGAGGDVGRNKVWNAKPDGLTIGFTSGTAMVYSQVSGSEGVRYDVAKVTWLARALAEPSVLVAPTKGVYKSGADLLKATAPVKFSVSGVGDDDFFALSIVAHALKIKVNPVTGYKGSKEASLAVITGEVDAFETSVSTMLPIIQTGDVKPLLVITSKRVPELPDVPTVLEVAKDVPGAADLLKVPINLTGVARVFFAPPNLPKDKYDALEMVLQKALNDPDMLQKAKTAKRPIDYAPGTEVTELVRDAVSKAQTIKPILVEALKAAQ